MSGFGHGPFGHGPFGGTAELTGPLLLMTPDQSRSRLGAVALLAHTTPVSASAWQIEEATTNYVLNPELATNATGWGVFAGSGSAVTSSRVNDQPDVADWVWRVQQTALASSPTLSPYTSYIAPVGTLTGLTGSFIGSVMVKASRPMTGSLTLRLYYTDNTFEDAFQSGVALTTTPQRLIFPVKTNNPAKTLTRFGIFVQFDRVAPQIGDVIWASKAQFENRAYASSYASGHLGPGYAWTGTAHASTSTRAAGMIGAPDPASYTISPYVGSAIVRVNRAAFVGASSYWMLTIGDWGPGSDFLGISSFNDATYVFAYNGDGSNLATLASTSPIPLNTTVDVYMEWTATTIGIRVGDGPLATGPRNTPEGVFTGNVYLGQYASAQHANGAYFGTIVFDSLLTADQVASYRAMESWTWYGLTGEVPGNVYVMLERHRPNLYLATPRFYKSDIFQTKLEDITPSRPTAYSITYNDDFDTKRQASFTVLYPDELKDLDDFIVADIEITDINGVARTYHLGHYVVMGRSVTTTKTTRSGSVECRDLTWIIQQMTMDRQVVTPIGVDPGAAARDYLIGLGIPERLIDIPDAGVLTTSEIVPLPGENWLSYITDVLQAGAMYQPWVDYGSKIVSRRQWDVTSKRCSGTLEMRAGAKIVPPVVNTPDLSRFRNRVTVVKEVPGEDPISATATVTDEGSPAHPNELRRRMGADRPIILGTQYRESDIATEAEARTLAEARLSEHLSYMDRLTLRSPVDDTLCGHRKLKVNVEHGGVSYHDGEWLQRVWTIRSQGPAAIVDRELTRTIPWR